MNGVGSLFLLLQAQGVDLLYGAMQRLLNLDWHLVVQNCTRGHEGTTISLGSCPQSTYSPLRYIFF